jgi:hypothetical protein
MDPIARHQHEVVGTATLRVLGTQTLCSSRHDRTGASTTG